MHRFWDSITRPLLEILQPQLLMEIGVSTGEQTIRLLEFAKKSGAIVHAVDPEMLFPLKDFETRFSAQLRFHKTTSIEAISALPRCDVYLIDGDHNYYSVFHELHAIGTIAKDDHPLILLHDTSWPYGRRDQYYNPERIPEEWRNPYAVSGVAPEQSDLDNNGINPWFAHAKKEGGERNGVLTAVEQYIAESPANLSSIHLQGLHGYSIIYPQILETQHPRLYQFLQSLKTSQPIADLITAIEQDRLTIFSEVQKKSQALVTSNHQVHQPRKEIAYDDQAITELEHVPNMQNRSKTTLSQTFKHAARIMIHDLHIVWKALGSPLPVPIRYIRHRILGQFLPAVAPVIQESIVPVTVALHWDTHNEDQSMQTLNSVMRLEPRAETILVIGFTPVAPEILQGKTDIQWIQAIHGKEMDAILSACTGDAMVQIEAGTILHPGYLALGIDAIRKYPSAGIIYCDWHVRSDRSNQYTPIRWNREKDLEVLHPSSMLRREAWKAAILSGATTWDAIRFSILSQGWKAVKSKSMIFYAKHPDAKKTTYPLATLCLALSGRKWMWEETKAFLERQTYPHDHVHIIILDTSQDATFGKEVRSWLYQCDYQHQTYLCEVVGKKSIVDAPRNDVAQEVSDACATIYNRFARLVHTSIVFTLEDDVIPPDNAFVQLAQILIEQKAATVSGVYRHRLEPRLVAWNWSSDLHPLDIEQKGSGIESVGGTGFGCLAIDGTLLKKTVFHSGPPWRNFDTNFFLDLMRSQSKKTLIDWNCSCRHYLHANAFVTPF